MSTPEDGYMHTSSGTEPLQSALTSAFEASRQEDPTLLLEVFQDAVKNNPDIAILMLMQARNRVEGGPDAVQASIHDQMAVYWASQRKQSLSEFEADFAEATTTEDEPDNIVSLSAYQRPHLELVPPLAEEPESIPKKRRFAFWKRTREVQEGAGTVLKAGAATVGLAAVIMLETSRIGHEPNGDDAA